jgi:hypothetical protein
MNSEESRPITRRHFARTLALPAGALMLGSALPAWAKAKKQPPAPASPSGSGSSKTKWETKVLWDFDGCVEHRFMGRVTTHVFNGNVYAWVLLPGLKTMIVKVPLDGGKTQMFPLMAGHVTGDDPHRYYIIGADALGYIHVVGNMHSSAHVKHWVSRKPEDISEFVFTSDMAENKRPQGYNVTYPKLVRSPDGVLYHCIRCADPVWGIGISVLDVQTQTWTMLGADVPATQLHGKRKNKKTRGKPMTMWEDDGEGGSFSYTQPHAQIRWDKNKRMHVAFSLLDENTPSSEGRHTGSDVLYAYSDDGGKTFQRGDGSQIQLPMRAEPGPFQADVVYSRHDGPPPWVGLMPMLRFDEQGRPVVGAQDHKTGWHHFVLENGKWTEVRKGAASPTADADDEDEDEESGKGDAAKLGLPYTPHRVNQEYLRETGNVLYTVFPNKDRFRGNKPKHHRIQFVLSKPVKAYSGFHAGEAQ